MNENLKALFSSLESHRFFNTARSISGKLFFCNTVRNEIYVYPSFLSTGSIMKVNMPIYSEGSAFTP